MKSNKKLMLAGAIALLSMSSCTDDFLDRQPLSSLTPANYFSQEPDLASYTLNMFGEYDVFATGYNPFSEDGQTDVMASRSYDNKYVPGQWKVSQTGGNWYFDAIYRCNYFFETVLPKFYAGKISGNTTNIKHDIGEMYLIRASLYFKKMQQFGDFPIVKTVLPDDQVALTEASKRAPHTEVARFILEDLDSAIVKLSATSPDANRNRLSKNCAYLLKSRVALYEGTFLKYFKNTAFVPNGPEWPGKSKDYNANYQFKSGSIDAEIKFFLDAAMAASKVVADAVPLVENNGVVQQTTADAKNKYCQMFSDVDLSPFREVLFWRKYDLALKVTNNIAVEMGKCNSGNGYTRGMVDGFLMANGLPIYAPGSGYAGDDSIHWVRKNRDGRLFLFLKEPGQINILYPSGAGTHATPVEPVPDIMNILGNADYPTGYANRKGLNYDAALCGNGQGYSGEVVFRAGEAYLNYIEACYENTGALDADADKYWKAIRKRAKVDENYSKTIAATDLTKEAANDWGVYSGANMVDATLYNIRRERRCELMAEGFRKMDLKRWRSYDQMITTPFFIEGFKLWGPMQKWYKASQLTFNKGDVSRVSDPALSPYLRVYQKTKTNLAYGGYRWAMAHYWDPIAIQHFLITSENNDVATSPIYQNPGWPTEANKGAIY